MDNSDVNIKEYLEWNKSLPKAPADLIDKAKRLMPSSPKLACPHCGKPITPFKKPLSSQRWKNIFWLVSAAASFAMSFAMHRFFYQFLAATLLFGFKWIVEQRATKTQIMIYKALSDNPEHQRLHRHSSRL